MGWNEFTAETPRRREINETQRQGSKSAKGAEVIVAEGGWFCGFEESALVFSASQRLGGENAVGITTARVVDGVTSIEVEAMGWNEFTAETQRRRGKFLEPVGQSGARPRLPLLPRRSAIFALDFSFSASKRLGGEI